MVVRVSDDEYKIKWAKANYVTMGWEKKQQKGGNAPSLTSTPNPETFERE